MAHLTNHLSKEGWAARTRSLAFFWRSGLASNRLPSAWILSRVSRRLQLFYRRFLRSFHFGRTQVAAGTVQSVLASRASPSSEFRRVASVRTRVAACKLLTFTANSPVPARSGHASAGHSSFLVKQGHRIGRPITFPNGQASTDGRCDEILCGSHAFSQCFLLV